MAGSLAARPPLRHRADRPAHRRSPDGRRCGAVGSGRARTPDLKDHARMCGIVGYIGPRPAARLLLEGLKRLEYRGYDSSGIAIVNGKGLEIVKAAGKISALEQQLDGNLPTGTLGIAHTRWATHGAPTTPNAHPHTDQSGRIAVIHNGIIENAGTIKKALLRRGHAFVSETDTGVLAHLIGEYYV